MCGTDCTDTGKRGIGYKLSPAKFFFAFHSLKTLIKVEKLRDQTDKLIKLLKRVNMRAYYF